MSKSRKLHLQLAEESLRNSRLWLEEAINFVYERASYGHSISLSLFSIEEAVKGWICFSVAIGSSKPSDPLVKEVFYDHHSKLETASILWYIQNIPLFQKAFIDTISEGEQTNLIEFVREVDDSFVQGVETLVKLRMKGMYVDRIEGKISSPEDIAKEEAEAFLYDAQNFVRIIETTIKAYKESSPIEKMVWAKKANNMSEQAEKNWRLIRSKVG